MKMFLIALVAIFGFGTLASAFGTFGVGVVTMVGTLREPPLGQVWVGLEEAPLGLV